MPNPSDLVRELESLMERRDMAAYAMVSTVETVVRFWEAQNYDESFDVLEQALEDFRRTDEAVEEFCEIHSLITKSSSQGDHYGNRSAAA